MSHTLDEFLDLLNKGRRYGHYIAGLCPWHDDHHPSLFVYEDDFFRCVGCGQMGPHSKLYEKLQNPSGYMPPDEGTSYRPPYVPDDLEKFAKQAHDLLNEYEYRKTYLTDRGLHDTIDSCGIGWFEGWYTVPVHGEDGAVEGMVLRASPAVQEASGFRFLQPTGQSPMPFIPARDFDSHDTLIVVFGIFDALVLSELGYLSVTTTGGKETFDPDWLQFWRSNIKIIPDLYEEETAYKVARRLGWRAEIIYPDFPMGCKDLADYITAGKKGTLKHMLEKITKEE